MIGEKAEVNQKKTGVNYERLGKAVEDALILDYIYVLQSTRRQITSAFVRGIFAGMGGVIGATVGIAILLGVLELFGGAPVIGEYVQKITETIEHGPTAPTPTPAPANSVATGTPVPTATPTAAPAAVPTATSEPSPSPTGP